MAHYKGGRGYKATVRDFSHVVEIAVPHGGLGKRLDAMHAFHAARRIKPCLGRGRPEDRRDYLRWYFARATTAEAFAAEFGGAYLRAPGNKID